jgi:hypothetical protein
LFNTLYIGGKLLILKHDDLRVSPYSLGGSSIGKRIKALTASSRLLISNERTLSEALGLTSLCNPAMIWHKSSEILNFDD